VIKEFVDAYMKNKEELIAVFSAAHPSTYTDIVKSVVQILSSCAGQEWDDRPDPERIHVIDDGDYQGTLVYVIAEQGYQPSTYWYVRISYGSCSGCDTLGAIRCYGDGPQSGEQVAQYMTLALHIVQQMKKMDEESA
jgi:hypothetical protein